MYVYMYICSVLLTHTHRVDLCRIYNTAKKLPGQVFSKSFCQGASELGVRPGRLGFLAGEVIGLPVFRYIRQNDGKNTAFRGGNDVSNFLDDPDF